MSDQSMKTFGVVAEYSDVDSIMSAARKVRDAGYTRWDVHTPFPVHGLDDAMAIRPTKLPWLVLVAGLSGLGLSMLMQWWMNAHDYAFNISGKPMFSLPANIPVTFESTILFAALTAFFGVFALNRMPHFYNPLFRMERFKRVTNDRFFVAIEARDPQFDALATRKLLEGTGAAAIEICEEPTAPVVIPNAVKLALVVVTTLALLPLAVAYKARESKTDDPRIHLVSDMDFQPKYKAQSASPLFEDGRAMRPQVPGTVARGELREDPHLYAGKVDGGWAVQFPMPVTAEMMDRGRERYDIFCSACHGYTGVGNGIVAVRAQELRQGAFVPPTSLLEKHIVFQPVGQLYDVIANGVRTMPAYGSQIPVADRWAIALYVRALQKRKDVGVEELPAALKENLK